MPDVESPEHEPGYSEAVGRTGTTDEESEGAWYSLAGARSRLTGDDVERRRDRERLINFVAAYVREVDRKMTHGQPGRAYAEVHSLDDAFGLFERRTVMRWNREQRRAEEAAG